MEEAEEEEEEGVLCSGGIMRNGEADKNSQMRVKRRVARSSFICDCEFRTDPICIVSPKYPSAPNAVMGRRTSKKDGVVSVQ